MAELVLEVHPLRNPVVTGESLLVTASIVNRGSETVEVPSGAGPSMFRYQLHPLDPKVPGFEMSWQLQREARIAGTPPPPRPLPPAKLPAKRRTDRIEDLTDLASRSFPPGKYQLAAIVFAGGAVLESVPIPIEIVAPKPAGLVTAFCRESRQRISAFAQNIGGGWVILQEQASMRRPDWNVWQRYILNPGPKGPPMLAVTVDEGQYVGDRWLGWMEGSVIHAARFATPGPVMPNTVQHAVDSGLTGGKLLSPGFQRPDGSALFFAYGDGKLAAYRFADAGASRLWEVASGADLSGAAISVAPGASMTAVYTEGNKLRYRRWSLDGKPLIEAADLFSLAEPLVSLSLEEVAAEPKLTIVTGPIAGPAYNVSQWMLNGAPKHTVSSVPGFSMPPSSIQVSAWDDRIELVAGFAEGYARISLPGEKSWTPGRPGIQPLSVDRDFNGKRWLHALEPGSGFRWIVQP